ncbi:GIY-YIG nuclease family protein [Vibrio atlanticus]|uniref:GIY-YIG nuclease family protein n=1 Tax=Vibrio atlanticus TaxID=693153 RepID=A0ABV4KV38_9VIBR
MGWIYIAWDKSKPEISKVGKTVRDVKVRISETENPDYQLFKAYEISEHEVDQMERDIHNYLSLHITRKKHKSTGRLSEWFSCPPEKALELVSDFIIKHLSVQLKLLTSDSEKIQPLHVDSSTSDIATVKNNLKSKLLARKRGEQVEHVRETIQRR